MSCNFLFPAFETDISIRLGEHHMHHKIHISFSNIQIYEINRFNTH